MPELPEVETVRLGITPHIIQQRIKKIILRNPHLRWPVAPEIAEALNNATIIEINRRGKYLTIQTQQGTLILHLGMSGSVRILSTKIPPEKHDHIDIVFTHGRLLRFNDPRRFGAVLLTKEDPLQHPLLVKLGPEPLSLDFTAAYLWKRSRKRQVAIKTFIMNSEVVAGIGNIYATEALFAAGIHPTKPVRLIQLSAYEKLVSVIQTLLHKAIQEGGTTLKNFVDSHGKPGYFKFHLKVYGRAGSSCLQCTASLEELRLGQRSTVYCPSCQPH